MEGAGGGAIDGLAAAGGVWGVEGCHSVAGWAAVEGFHSEGVVVGVEGCHAGAEEVDEFDIALGREYAGTDLLDAAITSGMIL